MVQIVDQVASEGIRKGIVHLYTGDAPITGNTLQLCNNEVVNFGSCSYLGLEFDRRLIEGSISAIRHYGTQFSESRAYVSIQLYQELESLMEQIFGLPVVITPTTTLGHISTIPVLINNKDALLVDHQVHTSVQTGVELVKSRGIHVELLRHNRMDLLEKRIRELTGKYERIWYLADGIYSMFGDKCPVDEIAQLLQKYPQFYFYADDAHGMSIYGDKGQGYVLSKLPAHERMVVATSLNKAFASGGGVIVFPNREMAGLVRKCGSTLITSGPMQPSGLGAAAAAARIHLSPELAGMQEELHDNIRFANLMLKKYGLPVISDSDAAVFFIGVSLPRLGFNLIRRMLNHGHYLNLGIFPAVPMKNTGVRFTITRLHSFEQIEKMIRTLAREFELALKEEGVSLNDIYKAFKLPVPETAQVDNAVNALLNQSLRLRSETYTSIAGIDATEWDRLFAGKGVFDVAALRFLEANFSGHQNEEDNWKFDYLIVRDQAGQPVLATFITTALWKDDMLSPAEISAIVEEKRLSNRYYLTSKVVSTGSLLTEGGHIYINHQSPLWKDAMVLLFDKLAALQESSGANSVVLRDFDDAGEDLSSFLIDHGFFKVPLPESSEVTHINWNTREEFYKQLSPRSMRHFRQDVAKYEDMYDVVPVTTPGNEQVKRWYSMYCQVKSHNLELNTFILPAGLFSAMARHPQWDIIELRLKNKPAAEPAAVMFSYISGGTYASVLAGLDYSVLRQYKVYRQSLYRMMMRARQLGCHKVRLGFSAQVEKKKVGAVPTPVFAFMQVKDSYNMQELANMMVGRPFNGIG